MSDEIVMVLSRVYFTGRGGGGGGGGGGGRNGLLLMWPFVGWNEFFFFFLQDGLWLLIIDGARLGGCVASEFNGMWNYAGRKFNFKVMVYLLEL